jgi:hypothetical protein
LFFRPERISESRRIVVSSWKISVWTSNLAGMPFRSASTLPAFNVDQGGVRPSSGGCFYGRWRDGWVVTASAAAATKPRGRELRHKHSKSWFEKEQFLGVDFPALAKAERGTTGARAPTVKVGWGKSKLFAGGADDSCDGILAIATIGN